MAGVSEADLNQLEEILLGKVQQRTPPRTNEIAYLTKSFRFSDLSGTGFCDFGVFQKALAHLTTGIAEQDLALIFDRYSQAGMLNYRAFAAEFVDGTRRQLGMSASECGEPWESVEETLHRIRSFLYMQGPYGITGLAAALRDADPMSMRTLSYDMFCRVLGGYLSGGPCQVSPEQVDQVFSALRQAHAPNMVAYDEFMAALKEEPGQDRRAAVRAAFRRLDTGSEGVVDLDVVMNAFNMNRHPQVSEGARDAEDVRQEFAETLANVVTFRRGQRSYPTNLVAWEEFEDYYKFISGCFETDALFCSVLQKVWDLDKVPQAAIDARSKLAMPAAGIPPKSRTGLHHHQTNTLPANEVYQREAPSTLDEILLRARKNIAGRGVRAAVDAVKNFYAADDDIDDLLDVYEFRRACQQTGIGFREKEEQRLFEAFGNGGRPAKLMMMRFLEALQGGLSPGRLASIERAFSSIGGNPADENSTVSPIDLKERFLPEGHPDAMSGKSNPLSLKNEFLDMFSLISHVRGGCQNGQVAFSDFKAYYEVASSTVDNDAHFDLQLRRVWQVQGSPGGFGSMTGGAGTGMVGASSGGFGSRGDLHASFGSGQHRRAVAPGNHQLPAASPLADRKPPPASGFSVYHTPKPGGVECHRRFMRKEQAEDMPPGSAPQPVSAITKSNIIFNETAHSELDTVCNRLRESVGRRGLGGWRSLAEKFQKSDYKRNGTVMRLDWERILKSLGLGLSPEERDALFKHLSHSRRDGAMDYREVLRHTKGRMPENRGAAVMGLFDMMAYQGVVTPGDIQGRFDPRSTPPCILGRKTPDQARQEFVDCTEFFGGSGFDSDSFSDFFSMVSALYEDDDDFQLMTGAAFGLVNDN